MAVYDQVTFKITIGNMVEEQPIISISASVGLADATAVFNYNCSARYGVGTHTGKLTKFLKEQSLLAPIKKFNFDLVMGDWNIHECAKATKAIERILVIAEHSRIQTTPSIVFHPLASRDLDNPMIEDHTNLIMHTFNAIAQTLTTKTYIDLCLKDNYTSDGPEFLCGLVQMMELFNNCPYRMFIKPFAKFHSTPAPRDLQRMIKYTQEERYNILRGLRIEVHVLDSNYNHQDCVIEGVHVHYIS